MMTENYIFIKNLKHHMKKTNLVFLLFITLSLNSFAQFKLIDKDRLTIAEGKNLMVVLKSDVTEYELPEKQKALYAGTDSNYNDAVKSVIAKYWQLTKGEIAFKTTDEINKMSPEDRLKYVYLESAWKTVETNLQGEYYLYSFNVCYLNSDNKKVSVFDIKYVPDDKITKADIIFFTKVLNNHIKISKEFSKYKESNDAEKNIEMVKAKTLLIDKEDTEITPETIQKSYDYKAEVVDASRIQSEIEKESDDYIFIKFIYSPGLDMFAWDAFDTKNCNIIGVIGTGGVKMDIAPSKYTMKRVNEPNTKDIHGNNYYHYETVPNPYYESGMRATVFRSKLRLKKSHLGLLDSKMAQKFNFR
jgi:hypothetical protein